MGVDLSKSGLKTVGKSLYECLFLVDSTEAASDWDSVVAAVRNVLERSEAEIVSLRKWDQRKLAYKIKGKTKGTYILCYFRVAGSKIQEIERNIQLSATIWRALILNAEQQTESDIGKDTPTMLAEKQEQKLAQRGAETETEEAEAERPEVLEGVEDVRRSSQEAELSADVSEASGVQEHVGAAEDVEQQDQEDQRQADS